VTDPAGAAGLSTPGLRNAARSRRNRYASDYLRAWNNQYMQPFDAEAKMSQFGRLWRGFTCGQLQRLFDENRDRNLPMMIRPLPPNYQANLASDYMFVGVTYWPPLVESMPGIFRSPLRNDSQAFAQGTLFVPTRRLVRSGVGPDADGFPNFIVGRQNRPTQWDLWTQNWTFQLVPATADTLPLILSRNPRSTGLPTVPARVYRPPPLAEMNSREWQEMNSH
jgi:hypothetical protein